VAERVHAVHERQQEAAIGRYRGWIGSVGAIGTPHPPIASRD
jgi:hypothetical protein